MKAILRRPEIITLLLLLIAFGISAVGTPSFLDARYLLKISSPHMEIGVMALAMTFVIISGNIDLSVASGLALIVVCSARLFEAGVPMQWVMVLAILMGIILGLFNGLLITKLGLPSLTVTLGTLALYRGLAQRLLGDRSIGNFPSWFVRVDNVKAFGLIPAPLIIFLVLALIFGIILHKMVFGRCVYAIGTNEPGARFSGLQVDRAKLSIFVLSGLMMAVGALMMMSRLAIARFDHAPGYELSVITAVVLGGTDIFGGRGSIIGTVLALFLLMIVQQGMILQGISAETQLTVTGSLLVVSVILANLTGKLSTRTPAPKRPAANPSGGELKHA
ncbi:MAG TPA: ABC transporter permease [Tepidisphaeraceae bacterium]|jgi:rhamnose transport system permease protein|nr:ABC transporter permease [Tepidisphaeraceae bacterium]